MGRRQRRIRAVLDSQFAVVATVLVVAALAGAGMTYTAYAQSGTSTAERPGPDTTYTGDFTHNATVQQSNPVFARGTTLSNRDAYFSRLTPTLDGTFTYRYTASETGNVTVDGTLTLVIASVDAAGEGSTVEYWRVTRRLDRERASLAPGESLRLSFSENVTQLRNESRRLDRAVGGTPGTIETSVVADIETEGRANGGPVEREQQYELGISPGGSVYQLTDPGPVTNTTQQTRTVEVASSPGPLRRGGGPALGLLGIGGLLALGTARYRGQLALDERERAHLTYETARSEFDDWITRARLPEDALDGAVVEVETLEGLVDIAIDSDRRVIEDGDGEYVVAVEDLVYRYDAPPEPGPVSWSPLLSRRTDVSLRDSWEGHGDDEGHDSNGSEPEPVTTEESGQTGERED
jgi:hypothetical protein